MARRRTDPVKADAPETELTPLVPEPAGIEILRVAMVTGDAGDAGGAGGTDGTAGTDGMEVMEVMEVVEGPGGAPAERPEDILAEPPDARDIAAELAAPPRRKLPWVTLLLSAGVVAAAAFTGGALAEKNHVQNTPLAAGRGFGGGGQGGRAGLRNGNGPAGATGRAFGGGAAPDAGGASGSRPGAGAGSGSGGGVGPGSGSGSGSATTFGTVKLVDGSTIYVTDAQGDIVKVTTAGTTKVTESRNGKVGDLQPGQAVVVRGSRNAAGDIAATTVTEGGPAGGGGFGGFGGPGGGGGFGGFGGRG